VSDRFVDVLKRRRSVRAFLPDEIPDGTIARIITAGTLAPTAGNMQAWYFYVVREEYLRRKLAEAALGQAFIAQAPVVIVVCADLERARAAYKERGVDLYAIQDAAVATQNMLLTVTAMGLGACWVGAFDEQAVADLLDLPRHHRPLTILPMGRPAHQPTDPGRRSLYEVHSEID
jgi:nitroreductase